METGILQKRATVVLIAGVLFNLSIGVLYAWGEIRAVLRAQWDWDANQAGWPYNIAIVCFALGVLIGGRIQDKIGPRVVVTVGGFFVGLGMLLSGVVGNNPTGIAVCFGVVSGLGIGLGYSCVTPTALKWFHPSKKGMVSGLIVGGFGLGAVYFAPLAAALLRNFSIENTFIALGAGIIVISVVIAQFVKVPPAGYVPVAPKNLKQAKKKAVSAAPDLTWREMMRTKKFYLMFIIFMLASSCGLMIIGSLSDIARKQAGITETAMLLSLMAIVNGLGRVAGGLLSDKIGRLNTLFIIFAIQMVNMIGFMFYSNLPFIIVGIIGAGFCFGSILAIFPALTADQFGLKNYGQNYGIVYLAWGLSGVVAPVIGNQIYNATDSFNTAYIICAVMMVAMIGVNYVLKRETGSR